MDFHREGFRRYLRHYVDELKASHPDFQVISNWAFSDHMPEAVSADVAGLSGDFSPDDSVNSARFAGRCLEDQGVPWDLMSWSFSRKTRKQKPAVQLMQEAALVLAMGGGYQAYFKQDRDGAIRNPAEMDVMAEVAQFCRDRQAYCHRSVAVPQIALLYSTAGHYRESPRLFHWSGSHGVKVLRKALTEMLQNQYGVQILSEHQLKGHMSKWPVVVVPGWAYLEPDFRDELAAYAKSGGRLVLIGPGPAKFFENELRNISDESIVVVDELDDALPAVLKKIFPEPVVQVTGAKDVDVSPPNVEWEAVDSSGQHVWSARQRAGGRYHGGQARWPADGIDPFGAASEVNYHAAGRQIAGHRMVQRPGDSHRATAGSVFDPGRGTVRSETSHSVSWSNIHESQFTKTVPMGEPQGGSTPKPRRGGCPSNLAAGSCGLGTARVDRYVIGSTAASLHSHSWGSVRLRRPTPQATVWPASAGGGKLKKPAAATRTGKPLPSARITAATAKEHTLSRRMQRVPRVARHWMRNSPSDDSIPTFIVESPGAVIPNF